MHLFITMAVPDKTVLPIHYNHMLQAALYSAVNPELAAFLHDQGYQSNGRLFKMFAFSRLFGQYAIDKEKNKISFSGDIRLVVASPVAAFCQSLANGLLTKGQMRLGDCSVEIRAAEVKQFAVAHEKIRLYTMSPVVAYSTLYRADGRKYTCYFQPGDPDFDHLIESNLRKKFQALYGQEPPPGEVKTTRISPLKMNIVEYKGTIIKGYSGRIELTGPQALLQLAVDAGLGSKNSQGFGCVALQDADKYTFGQRR